MKGNIQMKKSIDEREDIFKIDGAGAMISIFKMEGSNLPVVKFKGKQSELAAGLIFAVKQIAAQFLDDGVNPGAVRALFVDQIQKGVDSKIQESYNREIIKNNEKLNQKEKAGKADSDEEDH